MTAYVKRIKVILDATVEGIGIEALAGSPQTLAKAKLVVAFFYFHLIFLSVLAFLWSDPLLARQNFSPIWPVAWAWFVDYPTTVHTIRSFFVASTLVGGFFYWSKLGRFLTFLGIMQFHALWNSFGIQNHQWLPWLYASLLLIFLPNMWSDHEAPLEERKKLFLILWGAQALVLTTYFLSGFNKVFWAFDQIRLGEISAFSPEALARHIAAELPRLPSGILGSFFVEHPFVGWPLNLGAIYLQFFALWAAFKPSLHKLWAFGLVLFHIGSYLIMNILFLEPMLLLLVFFADSPLRKPGTTWRDIARDLPLFGWGLRRLI